MNESYIRNVIEAALLAAGKPLLLPELTQLFEENAQPSTEELRAAIDALSADYANRGIEVKETASGFRVQVRREYAGEISRLWPERPAKYSRALLETLALIAYRQPITRAEIESVRGVAVNPTILKAMLERNWIRVVGHRDVPGRPELLGTTREFLDYFGLKRLDDLPPLADLKAMDEIKVQLELPGSMEPSDGAAADSAAGAAAAAAVDGASAPAGASAEGAATDGTADGAAAAAGAGAAAAAEAPSGAETVAATDVAADASVGDTSADEAASGEGTRMDGGVTAEAATGVEASESDATAEGAADKGTAAEAEAERILSETEGAAAEVKPEGKAPVRVNVALTDDAVADEPAEVASDAVGDDDAAEDEELSAEGGDTHELVAAPPRNDD